MKLGLMLARGDARPGETNRDSLVVESGLVSHAPAEVDRLEERAARPAGGAQLRKAAAFGATRSSFEVLEGRIDENPKRSDELSAWL